MRVDYDVAMEVAAHEAIIRQAYKDSVGVWTWSVGLTSATGHDVKRYIGKPQTLEHCLAIYVWALDRYAEAVRETFADHPLTQAQFAAALSFHWNTGSIKKASWVGHFKAGRMEKAERSFKSWNKAGGKVSPGLVNRRSAEADLLFRGKWSNKGTMLEYTRLTSKSTPDWSSAKRINVEMALWRIFGETKTPEKPQDAQEPAAPTAHSPKSNRALVALVGAVLAAVLALAAYVGIDITEYLPSN